MDHADYGVQLPIAGELILVSGSSWPQFGGVVDNDRDTRLVCLVSEPHIVTPLMILIAIYERFLGCTRVGGLSYVFGT